MDNIKFKILAVIFGRKEVQESYKWLKLVLFKQLMEHMKKENKNLGENMDYNRSYFNKNVTMAEPKPGKDMKKNLAGGYSFKSDDFVALRRWLLTGSFTGCFYQNGSEMTTDNLEVLGRCIEKSPDKVLEEIFNASNKGTMASQHTAILSLVYLSMGNFCAKKLFRENFSKIVRTASHLYEFMSYVKEIRGLGKTIHKAVLNWIKGKDLKELEYQFLKYQNRYGWRGRDILRTFKPVPDNLIERHLYNWIAGGSKKNPPIAPEQLSDELEKIKVYEHLKEGASDSSVIKAIEKHNLTQEMIPSNIERSPDIWEALFQKMPVGATIRNLANLTSKGIFNNLKNIDLLEEKLSKERLKKARMHPITLANAYKVYSSGSGMLGSLEWEAVPRVEDVLEEAINASFETIEPTGKHFYHALDVSGSMTMLEISGFFLSPMDVSGIMALASIKSEKNYFVGGFSERFIRLNNLNKSCSFKTILNRTHLKGTTFGGTNAASAFEFATNHNIYTDIFVCWTDSESWLSNHPCDALEDYRTKINPDAKAVYITLVPYGDFTTLVDPKDNNSYDIGGFSSDTPKIIQMIAQDEF